MGSHRFQTVCRCFVFPPRHPGLTREQHANYEQNGSPVKVCGLSRKPMWDMCYSSSPVLLSHTDNRPLRPYIRIRRVKVRILGPFLTSHSARMHIEAIFRMSRNFHIAYYHPDRRAVVQKRRSASSAQGLALLRLICNRY